MKTHYLGIEIGGTKLQIVIGNENAQILERIRLDVDKEKGASGIQKQIGKQLQKLLPQVKPKAIGIGFGGPVDWQTGKICVSHQIRGWSGFDLAGWLKAQAEVPVFVDNDANVAALGEAIHGAGAAYTLVFYITLGSGVGGGLVINGHIYHGAQPGEAEIGHIRLDREGNTIESRCSGWAVDNKIRQTIQKHPDSILNQLTIHRESGEAKYLTAALQKNDSYARAILHETATDLAFGLSHVVHLFHPQIIILGGGLSMIGEPLQKAVSAGLPAFIMNAFLPGPQVQLATLGEDAVPIGALELAKRNLL